MGDLDELMWGGAVLAERSRSTSAPSTGVATATMLSP
jgi:hypothetical protein